MLDGVARFCTQQLLRAAASPEVAATPRRRRTARLLYLAYMLVLSALQFSLLVDQKLLRRSVRGRSGLVASLLGFAWDCSPARLFDDSQSLAGVLVFLVASVLLWGAAAVHVVGMRQVASLQTLSRLNQDLVDGRSEARSQSVFAGDEVVPGVRVGLLRGGWVSEAVGLCSRYADLVFLFYAWVCVELCMVTDKTYTKDELVAANSSYMLLDNISSEFPSLPLESYDARTQVTRLSEPIIFGAAPHFFALTAAAISLVAALVLKTTHDWLRCAYYNPFPAAQGLLAAVSSVRDLPSALGETTLAVLVLAFRCLLWYAGVLTDQHYLLQPHPAPETAAQVDNSNTLLYALGPFALFATVQLVRAVRSPTHVDFRANTLALLRHYLVWVGVLALLVYFRDDAALRTRRYEIAIGAAVLFSVGFRYLSVFVVHSKVRAVPSSVTFSDECLLSCVLRLLVHLKDRSLRQHKDQADLESKDVDEKDLEFAELTVFFVRIKLRALQLGSKKMIVMQSYGDYAKSASRWLQDLSQNLTQTKVVGQDRSHKDLKDLEDPVPEEEGSQIGAAARRRKRSSTVITPLRPDRSSVGAVGAPRDPDRDSLHDKLARPGAKSSSSYRQPKTKVGTRLSVGGLADQPGSEFKSSELPPLKQTKHTLLEADALAEFRAVAREGIASLPTDALDAATKSRLGAYAGLVQLVHELLVEKMQVEMGRSGGAKWSQSSQFMSVFVALCLNFTEKPALAYSYLKEYRLRTGIIGETSISRSGVKVQKSASSRRMVSWRDWKPQIDQILQFYSSLKKTLSSTGRQMQRRNSRVNTTETYSPKVVPAMNASNHDSASATEYMKMELPGEPAPQQSSVPLQSLIISLLSLPVQLFRLLVSSFVDKYLCSEVLQELISLHTFDSFDRPVSLARPTDADTPVPSVQPRLGLTRLQSLGHRPPAIDDRSKSRLPQSDAGSLLSCLYAVELLEQAKYELVHQVLQRAYLMSKMRTAGVDLAAAYSRTNLFLDTHQRATRLFLELDNSNAKHYTPAVIARVNYLGFVLQDLPTCRHRLADLAKRRFAGDLRLLSLGRDSLFKDPADERAFVAASLEKEDFNTVRSASENVAKLLDYVPSELVGGPLDVLLPRDFQATHRSALDPKHLVGDVCSRTRPNTFPVVRRNGSLKMFEVLVRLKADLRFGLEAVALLSTSAAHAESLVLVVDEQHRVVAADSHGAALLGLGRQVGEASPALFRGLIDTLDFCRSLLASRGPAHVSVADLYRDPIVLEQAKKYYELLVGGSVMVRSFDGGLFRLRATLRPYYLYRSQSLVRVVLLEGTREDHWLALTHANLAGVPDLTDADRRLVDAVTFAQDNLRVAMESMQDLALDPEYLLNHAAAKSFAYQPTGVVGSVHHLLGGAFATVTKAVDRVVKPKGPSWLGHFAVGSDKVAELISGFMQARANGPAAPHLSKATSSRGADHMESPSISYKLLVHKASPEKDTHAVDSQIREEAVPLDDTLHAKQSTDSEDLMCIDEVSEDGAVGSPEASHGATSGAVADSKSRKTGSRSKAVSELEGVAAPKSEREVDQASISSVEGTVKERKMLRQYLDKLVKLESLHGREGKQGWRVGAGVSVLAMASLLLHLVVGSLGFLSQYQSVVRLIKLDGMFDRVTMTLWPCATLGTEHAFVQLMRRKQIPDDYLMPYRPLLLSKFTEFHKSLMVGVLLEANSELERYLHNATSPIFKSSPPPFDHFRPLRAFMPSLDSSLPGAAFAPSTWLPRTLNQAEFTRFIQPLLDRFLLTTDTAQPGPPDLLTQVPVYDEVWELLRANLFGDFYQFHLDRYSYLRRTMQDLRLFMVVVLAYTHCFGAAYFVVLLCGAAVWLCLWRRRQVDFYAKLFRVKVPDLLIQELILESQLRFLSRVCHSEWLGAKRHRLMYLENPYEGSAKYDLLKLFIPSSTQHHMNAAKETAQSLQTGAATTANKITKQTTKARIKFKATRGDLTKTQPPRSSAGKRLSSSDRLQQSNKLHRTLEQPQKADQRIVGQQLHTWNRYVLFAPVLPSTPTASWSGFAKVMCMLLLCLLPLIGLNVFVVSSDNQKFIQFSNALSVIETAADYWMTATNSEFYLTQMIVYNDTKHCGNQKCSSQFERASYLMKNTIIPQIENLANLTMEPALLNVIRTSVQNYTFCDLIRKRFPKMKCGLGATAHLANNLPSAFRGISSVLDEAYQLATVYTTTGDQQALADLLGNPRMKAVAGMNLNGVLTDMMFYFTAIPAAKTIKKIYAFDANMTAAELQQASLSGMLSRDTRVLVFVGFQLFFSAAALCTVWRLIVPVLRRVGLCARAACLMLPYQLVMSNPLLSYKFND